jgi:hypothetical protein
MEAREPFVGTWDIEAMGGHGRTVWEWMPGGSSAVR